MEREPAVIEAPAEYKTKTASAPRLIWLTGFTLGVIGILGYALWALNGNFVRDGNWIGVDFHVYYTAAHVLARGEDIYTAGISPPYVYPPLLAALVVPLAGLPVNTATIAWKLMQHICLLVAGGLLVSMAPARMRPLAGGLLLLGLLTVPVHAEMQVGESNSLVLALTVGGVWLVNRLNARRGHQSPESLDARAFLDPLVIGAGLLLALAASIKVLPLLLVAYLWWRGPRTVAAVATTIFIALQLLLFALTPSTADYWFVQFPGLFGQAFPFLDNQSLNAFISRAALPTDPAYPNMQLFDGETLRPILTWLANLLVLTAAILVLWRAARTHSPRDTYRLLLEIGLVLMTTHLISGSTWLHHLVDLSVLVVALVEIAHQGGMSRFAWAGAILAALSLLTLLPHPEDWVSWANMIAPGSAPIAWLASSLPMFAVGGWLAWCAWSMLHRDQEQPAG